MSFSFRKSNDLIGIFSDSADRAWIDLVDELRALGVYNDVSLPQIAVMGDQSSGKSSVLEAISGVQFPRGSGLTTRCPTQLILKSNADGEPWRGNAKISGRIQQPKAAGAIKSPEDIPHVIRELTDVLTDSSPSAFSTETITIEIFSKDVPDLTVVDLPGIVRTTTSGQDGSVVHQVNSLIQSYLAQERTIILAIIPANQDIATVDILERAHEVDPNGERTLGVLTKPDLVGAGNEGEVCAVVKNVRKPLRLGYVMVRNRSQKESNEGVTAEQASKLETAFFETHSYFSQLDRSLWGTHRLTSKLTALLVQRIKLSLPAIKWELESQLTETRKSLVPLGLKSPTSPTAAHSLLVKIASEYSCTLRQSSRGSYRDSHLSTAPALRLHLLLRHAFQQFQREIAVTEPRFDMPDFEKKLEEEILRMQGRELPGFPNTQVFYSFAVQNVESWRPAVERCCLRTFQAAAAVANLLAETLFPQFPRLCQTIVEISLRTIAQISEDTQRAVDELFSKESEPFTTNENYLGLINKLKFQKFDKALEFAMSKLGREDTSADQLSGDLLLSLGGWYLGAHGVGSRGAVEDLAIFLQAYWHLSSQRMIDNICLELDRSFMTKLLNRIEAECFLIGTRTSDVLSLFEEDPQYAKMRDSLLEKRERIEKALALISKMAPEIVSEKKKRVARAKAIYKELVVKEESKSQPGRLKSAADGHSMSKELEQAPEKTPVPSTADKQQINTLARNRKEWIFSDSEPKPHALVDPLHMLQVEHKEDKALHQQKQNEPQIPRGDLPSRIEKKTSQTTMKVVDPLLSGIHSNFPGSQASEASMKQGSGSTLARKVELFEDNSDPFFALATHPAVISGAISVASNPAVQSAVKSAASDQRVQEAAKKGLLSLFKG